MNYTMTIDAPERVMSRVTRKGAVSRNELSRLFVAFLTERYLAEAEEVEDAVSRSPFAPFCGIWDESEFEAFQAATKREVNPEDSHFDKVDGVEVIRLSVESSD